MGRLLEGGFLVTFLVSFFGGDFVISACKLVSASVSGRTVSAGSLACPPSLSGTSGTGCGRHSI